MMIAFAFYLFSLSLLLAYLEVQIEGKSGWAEKLPTWRPLDKKWYIKLYESIMDNRELTGYHLGIFALVLYVLHSKFWWGIDWSWNAEAKVLSDFFLVAVVWDFLWFVINPAFGWRKFKPAFVAWHKSWLGPWPLSYYWGLFFSLFFAVLSVGRLAGIYIWLQEISIILLLVLFSVIIRVVVEQKK